MPRRIYADDAHRALDPVVGQLDARRIAAGLTIKEMCRMAGVHQSVWHKWTAGKFSPGMRLVRRIEAALDEVAAAPAKAMDISTISDLEIGIGVGAAAGILIERARAQSEGSAAANVYLHHADLLVEAARRLMGTVRQPGSTPDV